MKNIRCCCRTTYMNSGATPLTWGPIAEKNLGFSLTHKTTTMLDTNNNFTQQFHVIRQQSFHCLSWRIIVVIRQSCVKVCWNPKLLLFSVLKRSRISLHFGFLRSAINSSPLTHNHLTDLDQIRPLIEFHQGWFTSIMSQSIQNTREPPKFTTMRQMIKFRLRCDNSRRCTILIPTTLLSLTTGSLLLFSTTTTEKMLFN